ncbi:ABC transporter ATP-binding protein [Motilibacter deserti]|uniref:ATP-binding cassette domain-containing protein n=1 Tax=Motilibacter deserti TaxID=2714956 RepID=A0ABX0GQW6_9ACTN|nr:ATP-binding cassette domain-containing protein [Motilibacter deserti]
MSVRRRVGGRDVLLDCSARFVAGSLTAVVARNGAGKSVLARVLAGVDRPDAGDVRRPARSAFFLPERPPAPPGLDASRLARALAPRLAPPAARTGAASRVAPALDALSLGGPPDAPLDQLSKGSLQKAHLAVAAALRPVLVVLDEPFSGIDADALGAALDLVRGLAAGSSVVVLTAHRPVPGVDCLALTDGRLAALEPAPPAYLLDVFPSARAGAVLAAPLAAAGATVQAAAEGLLRARVPEPALPAVLRAALDAGLEVRRLVEDVDAW